MDIIKNYFRDPLGDYVLFGDVKQNIYGQPTSNKDVVTNVRGVKELKHCFRSDSKIRDLALSFQSNIFRDKYELDDFSEDGTWDFFGVEQQKEGHLSYIPLSGTDAIPALYNIIRGNILNKASSISPNDITILGYTATQLRLFDCYYRYASGERTTTMLETIEAMYMKHLSYMNMGSEGWFKSIASRLARTSHSRQIGAGDPAKNDLVQLRKQIARLFTLYDLYEAYPETFSDRLQNECEACHISLAAFLAFRKHYLSNLRDFKASVYEDNYSTIRTNKKIHFWMNSGTIKIATINSFKGWESEVLFLLIEPTYENETQFNISFDELLYTGLTRCKRHLIVVNLGNAEYDQIIRPLIERLSSLD